MAANQPADSDTRWAPEPTVETNEPEYEAVQAEIGRRGIGWAAEEIVSLRQRLASHKARTAKQFE